MIVADHGRRYGLNASGHAEPDLANSFRVHHPEFNIRFGPDDSRTKAWIEFRLVDQDNQPIANEPYRVRLPDRSVVTGRLDSEGKVRFEGILPGQASICFNNMDERSGVRCKLAAYRLNVPE